MFRLIPTLTMSLLLLAFSTPAQAVVIPFAGTIDAVLDDSGSSDLSGATIDTEVSGTIDDESFEGSVTVGDMTFSFDCCIAAGGVEISDNVEIGSEEAALLNSIQSIVQVADGDIYDIVNIEGDGNQQQGRLEVGLSLIYASDSFDGEDSSLYPTSLDPLFSLFFLLQENQAEDEDIFSAIGLVQDVVTDPVGPTDPLPSPVPLPAGGLMFLAALMALRASTRRS